MSASAARTKSAPVLVEPSESTKPNGYLKFSDEDCEQLFRLCTGMVQLRLMLYLLRWTMSAPGGKKPGCVAVSYTELSAVLEIDEQSVVRLMSDAAARGMIRKWSIADAVKAGLMKRPNKIADQRVNAWEPLRAEWPKLKGVAEDRPEKKAPRETEAKPAALTIAPGERMRPIAIQAEDKEITARVKEGSAPIAFSLYKGSGLIELVAFADPVDRSGNKGKVPGVEAREQKANTLESSTLSVSTFLTPVFEDLFSKGIGDALARLIAINLADTPFGYFRTIVVQKLKGDRSKIREGLFVNLAAEACEQYGNVLMRQIKAEQNGHSKEASSRFQTVFAPWCAKRQLDPSRPESADLFREETGEDVFA